MSKFILSAFTDEAGATLDEQLAAMKRNGLHYMEIRSVNGMNICDTPLETVKEYKKQMDEAGVEVMTVGSKIGKVSLEDDWNEHVALFLHTLAAARILGAKKIRMFSIFTQKQPDACRETVMARMEELLRMAEAAGITLCHENEKEIFGDVGGRVEELMDRFAGRMEFIFDPANFIQCGCRPAEMYAAMKDRISYFHMKDCHMGTGIVAPVGEGDGSIAEILTDYAKEHENVMLTVEPHLKGFVGLKDEVSIRETGRPRFETNAEAFDYAVNALKAILNKGELSYE